ncbi:Type II/IV secretion system protein [Candidatus Bilamarchaeum dharawalense]|uniref:Type II/IV secretion system protein n=1 Tax=Candidatus Bilamarchaeum dharawalense TaxID=2885759 RepID=A0A5E4LQ04_9ARCH|nr:Type II/IV secretion system protein [Candidatus Bilamarchaeum dharawalense]
MCNLYLEGTRAIVDLAKCPYEFASPEFLNLHLKDLSTTESPIKTLRYEEEIVVELNEEKTTILTQYASFIRQLETILLKDDIYGLKQDPANEGRRKLLKRFYEYVFLNPMMASQQLRDYNETEPEKAIYVKGYQTFKSWVAGILKSYENTKLYSLVKETGDLRAAFLELVGLKTLYFVPSLVLGIPKEAVPLKGPEAKYSLPFGVDVQIYEIPGAEAYLYVQENKIVDTLSQDLNKLLKTTINEQFKETFSNVDWDILMNLKTREYRQFFIDRAVIDGIEITPQQAMAMGHECAAWVVGLGAHIENLSLDKENITDIYIDSENSPLYVEHAKYGLCHTLYRYNRDLLDRSFKNIVYTLRGTRKFDESNPIVDVVLKRLSMRCHLQRPPATFGELQAALRIMKEQPFTYAQYLNFGSFTPLFAGYDDTMVTLGCSEAVLGLKGVGKTSFTAAKITSIGTRRRVIPVQDIEEIPVRAFRKRGFHIGAARVQSSDSEESNTKELDLVTMANALLRMGDAALIINEVRSRVAVQGIINLLNTQPGVFLLYNLHAESLRDIQDRLELVFGLPAASMYATDRYTFLKKVRFGRKGRVYRVLGFEFESDIEEKKFAEVFRFKRGDSITNCTWEAKFLRNPEASMWDFDKVNIKKLTKELDIAFVPPALGRRSEETGISPEQYMLQAFWKGKMYYEIFKLSQQMNDKLMLELDFVLKVNTAAGRLLVSMEKEQGEIDFGEAWERWVPMFKEVVKQDLEKRKLGAVPDIPVETEVEAPQPKSEIEDEPAAEEESDEGTRPEDEEDPRLRTLREKLREKRLAAKKK